MKPIAYSEFNDLIRELVGPACCLIYDGDYDRAVVFPSGHSRDVSTWNSWDQELLEDYLKGEN